MWRQQLRRRAESAPRRIFQQVLMSASRWTPGSSLAPSSDDNSSHVSWAQEKRSHSGMGERPRRQWRHSVAEGRRFSLGLIDPPWIKRCSSGPFHTLCVSVTERPLLSSHAFSHPRTAAHAWFFLCLPFLLSFFFIDWVRCASSSLKGCFSSDGWRRWRNQPRHRFHSPVFRWKVELNDLRHA